MGVPQKALLIYKKKDIPEAKVAVPSRAPLVVPRREPPEWEALGPSLGVYAVNPPTPPLPARKEEGGDGNLASG